MSYISLFANASRSKLTACGFIELPVEAGVLALRNIRFKDLVGWAALVTELHLAP
jgi:hypothetical protein